MIGASIYLACHDSKSGNQVGNVEPCSMCKRQILNAGIEKVIVRETRNEYRIIDVQEWIDNDESLFGKDSY